MWRLEMRNYMKVRIELEEERAEDEVVIYCHSVTDRIRKIQKAVTAAASAEQTVVLYKGDAEYFVELSELLFFETEGAVLNAHTRDDIYQTRYRLYELAEMFSEYFVRVSKSAIVNTREIYSITRNPLSTTSVIAFVNSHKQVFVSRHYSRQLKEKVMEVRMRA